MWSGGEVVSENYLVDPKIFRKYINEDYNNPAYVERSEELDNQIKFVVNYLKNNTLYKHVTELEIAKKYSEEEIVDFYNKINSGNSMENVDEGSINEDNYHRIRKIEYYDTLGQLKTVDDINNGTIPEDQLNTLTDMPIQLTFDDDTQERVTLDTFNNLYSHNDDVDMKVKDVKPEDQGIDQGQQQMGEDSMIDSNPTSMKMKDDGGGMMPMGEDEEIVKPEDEMYVEYVREYPSEEDFMHKGKKYQYCWAKYPNGKVDLGVYSYSGDITYGYKWFRKTMLGINENVNESSTINEDGHCRKDEIPVSGKAEGEKGSCKKKNKLNKTSPEEKKRSPHNIKQREKRMKDYESKKNNNSDNTKKTDEFEVYKKELDEMKESLSEDRRPSSLVNLDRLKKKNEVNFKSDASNSNTKDSIDVGDKNVDLVTDVDDPQKLSQDIEKEKLAQHKGESFENVGDSTNSNNKEIPKRNYTEDEANEVDMMRQGMQDVVYDIKPSEKFEERMKDDMGEDIYKQRQDKMDYKADAPMYNKDTQPVDDGQDTKQFDKYKSKYNSNKGIDENFMFVGKYKNDNNQNKFVNFKLNETVEITSLNENLKPLNLDGLGNKYTFNINENENYGITHGSKFYTDGSKVYVVNAKTNINEDVNNRDAIGSSKSDFNKMKKLMNYKPSNFVNTNGVKKNRGF